MNVRKKDKTNLFKDSNDKNLPKEQKPVEESVPTLQLTNGNIKQKKKWVNKEKKIGTFIYCDFPKCKFFTIFYILRFY